MNIVWLVAPLVKRHACGADPERSLLRCPLASARLRAAVAAIECRRAGHGNVFHDPGAGGPGPDWRKAGVCVVQKFYMDSPLDPWLEACAAARRGGCRLVIDVCDYPFGKAPVVQAFYRNTLGKCDAVTVNSERMAELMAPHATTSTRLIEDAILGAPGEPRFAPGPRLELLWFGHPTNLSYLDDRVDELAAFAREQPCRLTVVTQEAEEIARWLREIEARYAPALETRFVEWSLESTQAALEACDLVLIPSDPGDPLKAGASANRIAEALNAGRFAVASPLPSYRPFERAAWLGADLVGGIGWTLAHRDEVPERVRTGQSLVAARFSPQRIGRQWVDLFESLTGRSP